MPLELMYITNNPKVAKIAQNAGVDRIWIDMEYKGKEERQAGMNTVKSHHTVEDLKALRPIITTSALMVRVNPIDNNSEKEINDVIDAGAEYVMLPMFKTKAEVEKFIGLVNGRAKTILLIETAEAVENIEEIIKLKGIDEIHIGLNDLHLAYKRKFMFELLSDGTVEKICNIISKKNIPYGFGGIARLGYGTLPAEKVIAEHVRLGSTRAILSRSFCNASETIEDYEELQATFSAEIEKIREYEKYLGSVSIEFLEDNRKSVVKSVQEIVSGL